MSPFNRRKRATAKAKAGRHRKPEPEPLRDGAWPLERVPAVQFLANPNGFSEPVPPELADADYPLPRVKLPESRPLVSTGELMAALDADESTPLGDYDPQLAERVFAEMVRAQDDTQPPTRAFQLEDRVRVSAAPQSGRASWNGRTGVVWMIYPFLPVPIEVKIDGGNFKQLFEADDLVLVAADDRPTQEMPIAGTVVDETPQPAAHEGLAPVPVPSLPFLNAGAPEPHPAPTEVTVHVGNALPARLTDVELAIHGLPIPADAPIAPSLAAPVRRDARHKFRFDTFDAEFWEIVNDTARQHQAGPGGLRMSVDASIDALDAHLARFDGHHRAEVERIEGVEYAVWLANALADTTARPLPHRVPGAALAEIEATRGELVSL